MHFEHIGLNVPEPVAMAAWYVEHLNMKIVVEHELYGARFIADETGRLVFEIYCNPGFQMPDYPEMAPSVLHLAVATEDAATERDRLIKAGATLISDDTLPDGSVLVMLRDPWGVPLQLCQRATPMPL